MYAPLPPATPADPFIADTEAAVMNGLAVARLCEGLRRDGFVPDIVIGHCGWGETMFIKDVFPVSELPEMEILDVRIHFG